MIAMRRDEPHWLLNDGDARVYGQALQNALRHIPIRRAQKTLDFAMLIIAAGQFEIPRIYLSAQIAKARRQPQQRGAPVFQFQHPFQQPPPTPPPPPAGAVPPQGAAGAGPGSAPPPGANGAANGARNGATAPAGDMTYEPEADEPRFGPS